MSESIRITKDEAKAIAKVLTSGLKNKLEQIDKERKEVAYKYFLSLVPQPVLSLYEIHKDYFKKLDTSVYVDGKWYFSIKFDVPFNGDQTIKDEKVKEQLTKLQNQYEKAEKQKHELVTNLQEAIYNLRTYKRISEEFPEAIPFLQKKPNTELQINLNSLREQLKEVNQ